MAGVKKCKRNFFNSNETDSSEESGTETVNIEKNVSNCKRSEIFKKKRKREESWNQKALKLLKDPTTNKMKSQLEAVEIFMSLLPDTIDWRCVGAAIPYPHVEICKMNKEGKLNSDYLCKSCTARCMVEKIIDALTYVSYNNRDEIYYGPMSSVWKSLLVMIADENGSFGWNAMDVGVLCDVREYIRGLINDEFLKERKIVSTHVKRINDLNAVIKQMRIFQKKLGKSDDV